jgi:DNA-binding response OmpR family regulator
VVSKQATLLIVDDNEDNRDLLARRVRQKGYAVTVAGSGGEALGLIERRDFDLVLLDVEMPEMDGLEVLATIRETHSLINLPVIMVTCRDLGGDVVAALQMGANDHVSKPINFPVLFARIQTHLAIQQQGEGPAGTPAEAAPAAPTSRQQTGHAVPDWLAESYGDTP